MKNDLTLTDKGFNAFLNWLSPDREEAGKEYERVRSVLVTYFRFRGCDDCDELCDQTINRVISKMDSYELPDGVSKLAIFHSFAKHIFFEYLRNQKKVKLLEQNKSLFIRPAPAPDHEKAEMTVCFEKCLSQLDSEDHSLIIDYFKEEKNERVEIRKELANRFNINSNALHLRVYRIKARLKSCTKKCLVKKNL